MKKRNLNSKNLRLLSVGLLTSSAVLSVSDVQPVVAKEIEDQITSGSEEEESVEILSSTKEHETTESTIEEIEYSSSTENSTTSSTDDPTEETSSESSNSSDDPSSTQEPTDSTSTSETNTSTTDTTTSTTSSSTDSSTTSTTTAPSKPKPSKPKPKPKPSKPKPKPSKPKPAPSKPNLPVQGPIQQPSVPTPQPSRPMPNPTVGTVTGNTASGTSTGGSDQVFHISPNLTTKSFVKVIGEDARSIAGENNLYASVMIAQAILESASGNSALASAPNYNLFGIKGSYEGASANFLTSEDNGSGSMFTIRSNFRKYPSYKESLGDYVKLLRGGTDASSGFYSGTWKSNTKSYKDATKFLTGRYATDTSYNSKLNGLIDAYDLTQYDTLKDKKKTKKAKKITLNTSFDKLEKKEDKKDQNIEYLTHIVKKGESLKSISELYNISTLAILEKNQLDRRMLFIGQKLSVPKQEEKVTTVAKEDAVDRSLNMVQKLSNAFNDQETIQTNVKETAKTTSSAKKEATTKKEAKEYKVSATRKKTKETYEVKKGDTLASISKKTGISVWSLKEWNDLDQYFLTEGQQLILAPVYDLQS
ncbi:LysM peptidoglycan-binding domain-containing protein [Enterococcus plantarum]|uniref:glucosaminidase domain-containing protein n=1 Tax=Enterococcus plantarum TaxID=1077675 RepID=UPI001A8F7C10|nr:glucosaminidase domain-containing protein [Enterococcus plantarum]MBO0466436.1 LysM peptidoglycan-binding domain-containing protein [Enterococcus plantarum]